MVEHSVEQREARAADSTKKNPKVAPDFDYRTVNVHNATTERMQRGAPLVRGTGLHAKHAGLANRDHLAFKDKFKRSVSMPGFEARSTYGGTRMHAHNRSSAAISG